MWNVIKVPLKRIFRPLSPIGLNKSTFRAELFAANKIEIGQFKPILQASKVAIFGTSCANFSAAILTPCD